MDSINDSQALVPNEMACYIGVPRETIEECERVYGISKAARLEAFHRVQEMLAPFGQFKQWCEDHDETYDVVKQQLSRAYGGNSNRTGNKRIPVRLLSESDPRESEDDPYIADGDTSGAYDEDWPPRDATVEADPPAVNAAAPLREVFSVAEWNALDAAQRADLIAAGRDGRAGLNEQTSNSIEWALWSWNPVTGCLHNCPYCYARDIAQRFTTGFPRGFDPTFLPSRLGAPIHQRVPAEAEHELGYKNIFTCSMADLFGKWVPSEWIEAVLDVARACPQWNFLFLTKFPNRLAEFTYPENAWLGTTVDCQARVKNAERSFAKVKGGVKWLSVEPMLEPLHFDSLSMFNWVVIGGASASSQTPAWSPPRRWVDELEAAAREAGCMVYEKTNLQSRLREYPGWERQEAILPRALAYLPTIGQDGSDKP